MAETLVTGGAGFLGHHLVTRLVKDKQDVCATYNYTPPPLRESQYLHWFRCDATEYNQVAKLLMQENPEIIYHLVAQPIVTAAMRDPLLTYELTTRGTWNLFEAVRRNTNRVKAIVFVSSDKVYGSNALTTEWSPLDGGDHPYNTAKIAADVIAQSYVKAYGLPIVISRSANLYGSGDFHWDRLIPGTCRDLHNEQRPVIRSNGKQVRDYIHVSDSVRGLMLMADAMAYDGIRPGEVFNFGSERGYSVLEIVDMLRHISGRVNLEPIIENKAKNEINVQHIIYQHATEVLRWKPEIPIEQGLEVTYGWYRKWFEA